MFSPRSGSEESRKRSKPALTPVREVRRRLGNCSIETKYLRALRLPARETLGEPRQSSGAHAVQNVVIDRNDLASSPSRLALESRRHTAALDRVVGRHSRPAHPPLPRSRPDRQSALLCQSPSCAVLVSRVSLPAMDSCTPLSGSRCPPLPAVRPSVQNVSPPATGVSASIIEFCTHSLLPHIPSPSRSVLHQGPLGRAEAMPETRTPSIARAETESNGGQTAIRPRSGLLAPRRRRALEYLTPRTDAHRERRSDVHHDACTGAKAP